LLSEIKVLDGWIARQREHAIAGLLRSISAPVVKTRSGFGQVITPAAGSVVASPVTASYDPDPDYFFHWFRDSAAVMDALALVRDAVPGSRRLFEDFVDFSLALSRLDGREMPPDWRAAAAPDFVRFLRRDIGKVHGDAISAETRVNPDGTLDISDWPRPQYDGPALRALALLRWGPTRDSEISLLKRDLAFILAHAREPCFDIWEEEVGLHYYTVSVCEAALAAGAAWCLSSDQQLSAECLRGAGDLAALRQNFWLQDEGYIRSRMLPEGRSTKELDISVILAANHARQPCDSRLLATLNRLAALFGDSYVINSGHGAGPAMGRYASDRYYSGGAYYFSTLGAAEFCYRMGDRNRGDAFLTTVQRFTPENGLMSEQFDRTTGAQTSAKDLAWSYAAFLTCAHARETMHPRSHAEQERLDSEFKML
jgi:glucoamylase